MLKKENLNSFLSLVCAVLLGTFFARTVLLQKVYAKENKRILKANHLRIIEQGLGGAEVSKNAGGGKLVLLENESGKERVQMTVGSKAPHKKLPAIGLSDNQNKLRLITKLTDSDDLPLIAFRDRKEKTRFMIGLSSKENHEDPYCVTFDQEGTPKTIFGQYQEQISVDFPSQESNIKEDLPTEELPAEDPKANSKKELEQKAKEWFELAEKYSKEDYDKAKNYLNKIIKEAGKTSWRAKATELKNKLELGKGLFESLQRYVLKGDKTQSKLVHQKIKEKCAGTVWEKKANELIQK
jgi:hypothetical protein